MDMWAIGCVVYELFTGKILFNGRTNNEMLKRMMDVKGPFPKKMLRKGAFTAKHFDSDPSMSFRCYEDDPITRQPVRPVRDLGLRIRAWGPGVGPSPPQCPEP